MAPTVRRCPPWSKEGSDRSRVCGRNAQIKTFDPLAFLSLAMGEPEHIHATYNDIHNLIKASADKIAAFKPNLFVAIGLYFSE